MRWPYYGIPLLCSCAFLVTDAPPPDHKKLAFFECDTSRAPAVFDTISAVLSVALLAAVTDDTTLSRDEREGAQIWWAAWAALHTSSALWGFNKNGDCAAAKRALSERMVQQRAASTHTGCASDAECKGDRLCVNGACVSP